jgi:hypothetical protein
MGFVVKILTFNYMSITATYIAAAAKRQLNWRAAAALDHQTGRSGRRTGPRLTGPARPLAFFFPRLGLYYLYV